MNELINFLSSEGIKPTEMYHRMKMQFGDVCLFLQQVYEWSKRIRNGVTCVRWTVHNQVRYTTIGVQGYADAFLEYNGLFWRTRHQG